MTAAAATAVEMTHTQKCHTLDHAQNLGVLKKRCNSLDQLGAVWTLLDPEGPIQVQSEQFGPFFDSFNLTVRITVQCITQFGPFGGGLDPFGPLGSNPGPKQMIWTLL